MDNLHCHTILFMCFFFVWLFAFNYFTHIQLGPFTSILPVVQSMHIFLFVIENVGAVLLMFKFWSFLFISRRIECFALNKMSKMSRQEIVADS